jgi:poly(3-hydroxybutyrate) depolymerase
MSARIGCPVYLIAGERDHITPAPQVWAHEEHVDTDPADVMSQLAPAGHLGLFMGREALQQHWLPVLLDMRARSNTTTPAKTPGKEAAK